MLASPIDRMIHETRLQLGRIGPDNLRDRILAAYAAPETIEAAAGHVSSLETEHGPAEAEDAYNCFDACGLPRPDGFDPGSRTDDAIIRAALAERIRDELAAREALEAAGFAIGDRIQAGRGEDHDTGRIIATIDARLARVAWDSGVVTSCPIADMSRAK
jgi:hypothetical protein